MNKFPMIFFLALNAVFTHHAFAQENLSQIPTNKIVAEYRKRLDEFVLQAEKDLSAYVSDGLISARNQLSPRKFNDTEIEAIDKRIEEVMPYAIADDKLAKFFVVAFYDSRHKARPYESGYDCKILNMAFDSAGDGLGIAAGHLANLYRDGDVLKKDRKLYHLWSKEANHRDHSPRKKDTSEFGFWPKEEFEELNQYWTAEWFPRVAADEAIAKNNCP